jgi:hypothetical protein
MENVAVIKDNVVINIVTVDEIESIGALNLLLPEMDDFVLQTEETGTAFIGGTILQNKFVSPSPYESWSFNEATWQWEAPVAYPADGKIYTWDDASGTWSLVEFVEDIIEEGSDA